MKKNIILMLMLLIGAFGIKAQEWRGFIEIHAGIQPGETSVSFNDATISGIWNPLSFGLNYTMGIRVLPQLFAGVGIGGYAAMMNYNERYSYDNYYESYVDNVFPSLYFPVFANVRWIPDITKKINPYVDLKIGYQMGVDLEGSKLYLYDEPESREYFAMHKNGLFLQPGVGVRFGRDSAFNLGLAYNVSMRRDFVAKDTSFQDMPVTERITKNFGIIMLTFGADF